MEFVDVRSNRGDAVLDLRIARPERRNALSRAVIAELDAALEAFLASSDARVVVLSGEGGFSSGSDLVELAGLSVDEMAAHETVTAAFVRRLQAIPLPVVAAVEGFAFGGGFLLAIACDVVVTGEDARWRLMEVPLGWTPPWGLHSLLARMPAAQVLRLVWAERELTGINAFELGCADELTPNGSAHRLALEIADRLADLPPGAVASTKSVLATALRVPALAWDQAACEAFVRDCQSTEAQASLSRFANKKGT